MFVPLKGSLFCALDSLSRQSGMFLLIWTMLFFSMGDSSSDTDCSNTTVGNLSFNACLEARENLTCQIKCVCKEEKGLFEILLMTVKQPQVIIAFLTGILLSVIICCLVTKCHRKKTNSYRSTVETLEMVTTPLMNAGQFVENDTHNQEVAEGAAAGRSLPDMEPREVEYSDIDFSRWSKKIHTGAEVIHESTETEYAELKEEAEEGQDKYREDGEGLEGNKDEVEMMDEDAKMVST